MYENIPETYEIERNFDETKTTLFLYNGAFETDEDPADYLRPVKAVRIA